MPSRYYCERVGCDVYMKDGRCPECGCLAERHAATMGMDADYLRIMTDRTTHHGVRGREDNDE